MIKKLCVLLCLLVTAGCAGMTPYTEIQLNYALPFSTDYWQHSDRSWQCEQPQFRAELGASKRGYGFGVYHESMLLCGTFNTKPEIYENGVFVYKRWEW